MKNSNGPAQDHSSQNEAAAPESSSSASQARGGEVLKRELSRRPWKTATLLVFGMVTIIQFQNCAPQGRASGAAASGNVSIIDKNDTQGLDVSFAQKQVVVQSSAETVSLQGICSTQQDGAVFQWQLTDSGSAVLDTGMITCKDGSFQVQINPAQNLDCNAAYQVSAQLGTGSPGQVFLTRECSVGTGS